MSRQYKIIRDPLHGDIVIENRFLKIIDTKEFQRLRRIKQLSVADLAFPGAVHTRFSHSLGTFHIMKRMISHFDKIFYEVGVPEIEDSEKNVALLAALLHDIGHGPFSHSFEAFKEVLYDDSEYKGTDFSHESMSVDIITNEKTSINQLIVEIFGEEIPNKVADMIRKKPENTGQKSKPNLEFVLSSLISSQLDADRMDYLLRDSMHTGAKFGKIDIERLIEGLFIDIIDNKYHVCIKEKYAPDVENYLLARYQMHKGVYYHDFKCEMELIVEKILLKAQELFCNKKCNNLPNAMQKLFNKELLSVEEHLSLDDTIFYSLFHDWKDSDDFELAALCRCFLERTKFTKVLIEEKSTTVTEAFKNEFIEILNNYQVPLPDLKGDNHKKISYFIEYKNNYGVHGLYKKNKDEEIFVINNGVMKKLSEISEILALINGEAQNSGDNKTVIFFNLEIFKEHYKKYSNYKTLFGEINKLIKKYNRRNQIEIESKYIVNNTNQFYEIIQTIKEYGVKDDSEGYYEVGEPSVTVQRDTYYDTNQFELLESNKALRIRTKEESGKYFCTIKLPAESDEEKDGYSKRFEHEKLIPSENLMECADFINNHLSRGVDDVVPKLEVTTRRTKYNISEKTEKNKKTDSDLKFEMVLDEVAYKNLETKKSYSELQVEIELKSDYLYKIRLHELTKEIQNKLSLCPHKNSKYRRGIEKTKRQ